MFISLCCTINFPFPHRELWPIAVSNGAAGMRPRLPRAGRARQGRAPARPYLIRRHAARRRACRKHMSPVKHIVKASITSLWRSWAEFVPTAGISCTPSHQRGRPSPLQGTPLAPRRWGNPVGSCETPSRRTKPFLSAPCFLPKTLPSACKPPPNTQSIIPGSLQQIAPRASCTATVVRAPCACCQHTAELGDSLYGPQPLAVP